MKISDKLFRLSSLSEAEFRTNLLIPLLRKMGFTEVRERHGPAEYGKDITFVEIAPLGTTYHAIVAKVGNISGSASGKQNLAIVKEQVKQAFNIPFYDIDHKRKQVVNHVIVWTTGNISNSAETQIVDSLSNEYRNVDFKNGQATVELLEKHFPSYFSVGDVFTSDYYSMAKEFYGRLEELRTLGTSSDRFRLPVIYVPPTLKQYFPRLKDAKAKTQHYFPEDILNGKDNFLVIGRMGAGKSTLLRRLLLTIIENNEVAGNTSPLPVFIVAKRLDLAKEDCIESALSEEVSRLSPISNELTLLSQGSDTPTIVFIDGVDELRDDERILTAFERISSFAKRHPHSRVVVSSRPIDLVDKSSVASDFNIVELEDLTPPQFTSFIENWFGKGNPISTRLTRFLQDPLTLHGLPSTPLTLAIIAILYSNGLRELPANLTELFSKYTELALGRWDEGKDISQQFEWRVKQFLIRGVAWSMHDSRATAISLPTFDKIIADMGNDRGLAINTGLFREEVVDRSELIMFNEEGEYEFKHRAFQDYFTAQEIASRAAAIDIVVNNFLDQWWEQAIFFVCGLHPESADFLDRIMSTVTPNDDQVFSFAVNLGMTAQASYLAPRSVKAASIHRAIDGFIAAYFAMQRQIEADPDTPSLPAPFTFDTFLVAIIALATKQALGSISLADVLAEIVRDHLQTDLGSIPPDQRETFEWKSFLLATACAASDNVNEFIDLVKGPLITKPLFRILSIWLAEELKSHTWLTTDALSRIEHLHKKLSKSMRDDMKYLPEPLRRKAVARTSRQRPLKRTE